MAKTIDINKDKDDISLGDIKQLIYEIIEIQKKGAAEFEKWKNWTQKNIAGMSDSNGAMAEEAIYNVLEKDKKFAGITFDDIQKNIQIQSENFRTLTELDILMLNGDSVALIETKYKVEKKDVNDILHNKLSYFRQCYPHYSKHKVVLGIGGMSFEKKAEEEAKNNGVGIIKVVGDKVEYFTDDVKIY